MSWPPPLSCDCHIHVFGPFARYPLDPARKYTPEEATLQDYLKVSSALGLGRGSTRCSNACRTRRCSIAS